MCDPRESKALQSKEKEILNLMNFKMEVMWL